MDLGNYRGIKNTRRRVYLFRGSKSQRTKRGATKEKGKAARNLVGPSFKFQGGQESYWPRKKHFTKASLARKGLELHHLGLGKLSQPTTTGYSPGYLGDYWGTNCVSGRWNPVALVSPWGFPREPDRGSNFHLLAWHQTGPVGRIAHWDLQGPKGVPGLPKDGTESQRFQGRQGSWYKEATALKKAAKGKGNFGPGDVPG